MKLQASCLLAMLIFKSDEWTNKFQCVVFNQVLSVFKLTLTFATQNQTGSEDFPVIAPWYKFWTSYKMKSLILHLISLVSQKQKLLKWTEQWKTSKQR